jgi:methylmalonyl-CoA/ethylmalonyl-CoA epimerase
LADPISRHLGAAHHLAYVVDDIEATVGQLVEQLDAGPFFLIEKVPLENVTSQGEPAEFVHNSAFGSCGGGVIELMQAVSLAPERVSERFAAPHPRVHHVGYVVSPPKVDEVRSSLEERGMSEYLSSELNGALTTVHDASAVLGHDLEIHADNEGLHNFFAMVRTAGAGWDGGEPLRKLDL